MIGIEMIGIEIRLVEIKIRKSDENNERKWEEKGKSKFYESKTRKSGGGGVKRS